jgi:UDP-N-acetyl-D-mannosaminuronic acid dehydrogenase
VPDSSTKNAVAEHDLAVIGGAGHVGAPFSILMASKGLRTLIHDIDRPAMEQLARGEMPFLEEGGEALLRAVLAERRLDFSADISRIARVPILVLTIGTSIDEFHNPQLAAVTDCIDAMLPWLSDEQTIILRSTVLPGMTDYLQRYLHDQGRRTRLAFCPERVVQGSSIRELQTLPQIVSGTSPEAEETAGRLFQRIAPRLVRMAPKEAEFAKLFSNAYRYIQFAISNQFYMMAQSEGVDYARIHAGLKEDYPRMRDLPGAGFAAGPCLYKDTFQLVAFANNQFGLGYSAIQINEGLPAFIVRGLQARHPLAQMTVGLLGMAFKANSDDVRASLSYKLKKLLRFAAREVLTTDPYVKKDDDLLLLDEVIGRSDVLILCVPHSDYRHLDLRGKPLVDIWSFHQGVEASARAERAAGSK